MIRDPVVMHIRVADRLMVNAVNSNAKRRGMLLQIKGMETNDVASKPPGDHNPSTPNIRLVWQVVECSVETDRGGSLPVDRLGNPGPGSCLVAVGIVHDSR